MWANLQILFWIALFSGLSLKGQNLVMDSGFEGADPALRSGSWVAVAGTPDYYNTSLPDSNTNYGLEQFSNAVEGNVYLGIACLGASRWQCRNSREYVSGRLVSLLEAGQLYEVSLYVRLADFISSFPLVEMGIFFSRELPGEDQVCDRKLKYLPLRGESELLFPAQKWLLVKGTYVAEGGEQFLAIGNFLGANLQHINDGASNSSRSYYFIDNVSVIKAEGRETSGLMVKTPQPVMRPSCTCTILFETGSSRLPASYPECMQQVFLAAAAYPGWQLKIAGFTDDVGTEKANRLLSEARAEEVARFFIANGIPPEKVTVQGYGASMPVDQAQTPEGRARNRRVEAFWRPPPLEEWQFQLLEAFAILYGYVRFFHPYYLTDDFDWNRFALFGISRISQLRHPTECLKTIRELFYPVAPTMAIGYHEEGKCLPMEALPPASLTAEQTYWQHYGYRVGQGNEVYRSVRVSPAGNEPPLFKGGPVLKLWQGTLPLGIHFEVPLSLPDSYRSSQPDQLAGLEEEMSVVFASLRDTQLANVTIFWNLAQHFYPYRETLGNNWQEKLVWMLRQAAEIEHERTFNRFFKECSTLLKDGHAAITHEDELNDMWLPLELAWLQNQLVVAESAAGEKIRKGDILRKIDGADAVALFHQDTFLVSGTAQWKVARALKDLGADDQYSTARLEMQRGGLVYEAEVIRDWADYLSPPPVRELEEGYYYVDLKSIYDIDSLLERASTLSQAKGVIFDVRGYLNNNFSKFLPCLLSTADTVGNWINIPQIIYPGFFEPGFDSSGWLLKPMPPHITAKLAFLADGRAISASESFLAFVRHYRLGPIIGSPTAGANGPRNWTALLGGYFMHWTGAWVTLLDGSPVHNQGITPDYQVTPSLEGVQKGKDEILDFALAILKTEER
ncbi:MAG: OmpA family protein [Lewinellaceae bacterium]|nr:OmpA family protein [Lewinellaceae bacterium]